MLTNNPSALLHGRKAGAFCHVDGIDSMFTREEAKQVAQSTAQAGGRECYCLAWEFEMDLHLLVNASAQELGVKLKLIQIPREIMEKNRKSPPPFLEVALLTAEPVYRKPDSTFSSRHSVDRQDYRTRKDRSLKTISDAGYNYPASGQYIACVKGVNTFGCDTSITVEVEV